MEKCIVEFFDNEDSNKVAVYPYDEFSKLMIDSPEVMSYQDAKKNYKIIGTMIDGEIEMEDDDDDYYSDYDEDDEDEDSRY